VGGGFPVLQLLQGELGERFKATTTDIRPGLRENNGLPTRNYGPRLVESYLAQFQGQKGVDMALRLIEEGSTCARARAPN
jgi:hypothetical protein